MNKEQHDKMMAREETLALSRALVEIGFYDGKMMQPSSPHRMEQTRQVIQKLNKLGFDVVKMNKT